jgi:SAM-dependent methyltransferase
MRAMIHILTVSLFGKSLMLPDYPVRHDLRGIGLSDWEGYAARLTEKFNYINTFYHKLPKLDIMAIPAHLQGSLDFLIATDVFEHVPPPVDKAFRNARRLLKAGGFLVMSAPYTLEPDTREHFPDLHDYRIEGTPPDARLINRTKAGIEQVFSSLLFHGGDGTTLETRVFSKNSLLRHLEAANFEKITIFSEPHLEFGIRWGCNWSLPMSAIASGRLTKWSSLRGATGFFAYRQWQRLLTSRTPAEPATK